MSAHSPPVSSQKPLHISVEEGRKDVWDIIDGVHGRACELQTQLAKLGTRGEGFLDIHLNESTRWKDVPERVWSYTLDGYQVLKKWLSYRESALLGRSLTGDEAQDFTHHVRRIAAILTLHPQLDAHYKLSAESPEVSLT